MAIDPTWIALIGTLTGGVGLKVAEHYLGRSRVKIDDAAQIREELRMEIVAQREEIKALELGLEKWREEYYNLRDKYVKIETELMLAVNQLKAYDQSQE